MGVYSKNVKSSIYTESRYVLCRRDTKILDMYSNNVNDNVVCLSKKMLYFGLNCLKCSVLDLLW